MALCLVFSPFILCREQIHHQLLDAGANTRSLPELFRSLEDDSALSNPVVAQVKKDVDKLFYFFLSLLF